MKTTHYFISVIVLFLTFANSTYANSRDWTLNSTQGKEFTLFENLSEGPVLLLFWATWCAPCKAELEEHKDYLNSLSEQGVKIVLVSEDNQKSQSKVKPYIESKGYKWTCLLDTSGEVLKRYGGTSIPFSVLIDKDGDSVTKIRGAIKDKEALSKQINDIAGKIGE